VDPDKKQSGPGPPNRLLVTVGEACRLLSLSRSGLYDLMSSGALPYVQIGRSRRLALAELEQFVSAMRCGR